MKNKIFIQLFLLIIFVLFIILFYFKYFSKKEQKVELLDKDVQIALKKSETNLIKDIEYLSYDDQGNEYLIYSKFAEISASEPEVIFMRIVTAKINSIGREPIIIKSDKAKYNSNNYDTNFEGNVSLTNPEHKITSGNLDLSFQKNLIWVYSDIKYQYFDTILLADRVEIDLITKDSKIFMNDKKKVKVFSNN